MADAAGSMYDPHVAHRGSLQGLPAHHSPHMNHASAASAGMHGYHVAAAAAAAAAASNHVSPVANHVMGATGAVPDVHKRDKDAIYG